MKKRAMAMILAVVMSMACVAPTFAAENVAVEGDGERIGTIEERDVGWGYVKIFWANECSEAYAYTSTHQGKAYYIKTKVYATYSNGDARGPSNTASKYNTEKVETDTIYENERFRQFFAEGSIQDTKTSGTQNFSVNSPLWEG